MNSSEHPDTGKLVDHLFRHEAGKMVAVLTRLLGFKNLEQAEDIVQDTILSALNTWKFGKVPDNPQAWLYQTARNKAIDLLRRQQVKYKIDTELAALLRSEYTLAPTVHEMFTQHEIKDSQLRMMFACCHPSIAPEAQIPLMLKTLCGLSVKEISSAFLTNEENISKRIYRTKEKIRSEHIALEYPGADAMPARIDAILKTLYLLFNEGYNSSHPEKLIREDLCEEAMRLTILLSENEKTSLPETNALLALMCYHVSRFNTRIDDKGMIILLKDQDRKLWNKYLIGKGNEYMERSAEGGKISEMHLEAGIASLHANAETYEDTHWKAILHLYDELLLRTGNPMVALNRALVQAEDGNCEHAIRELEQMKSLWGNCYYHTSLAELYLKTGQTILAKQSLGKALELTNSHAEIELIRKKLRLCE
jgi:RNA polymerase sigma factor (sigma-70 family)